MFMSGSKLPEHGLVIVAIEVPFALIQKPVKVLNAIDKLVVVG